MKLWISLSGIAFLLVFFIQNMAPTEVRFLIWEFEAPIGVLMGGTFALGGLCIQLLFAIRRRKRLSKAVRQQR